MNLKFNKVLKFVNCNDPEKFINISMNITTSETDEKFLKHVDDIISTNIKIGSFKSLEEHKEQIKINKQTEKQQQDYLKKMSKEKELQQKKAMLQSEKAQKEKEKQFKKYM